MFSGFDTDQSMLRIGAMNMMLHGVEAPNITWMDSLSEDNTHREEYSLILANPPFGTKKGGERATRDDFTYTTSNKQLNFLQHIYRSLRTTGNARAAVVLPE